VIVSSKRLKRLVRMSLVSFVDGRARTDRGADLRTEGAGPLGGKAVFGFTCAWKVISQQALKSQ
jgi:hypothetical protein